jgi:hypothetical protein
LKSKTPNTEKVVKLLEWDSIDEYILRESEGGKSGSNFNFSCEQRGLFCKR